MCFHASDNPSLLLTALIGHCSCRRLCSKVRRNPDQTQGREWGKANSKQSWKQSFKEFMEKSAKRALKVAFASLQICTSRAIQNDWKRSHRRALRKYKEMSCFFFGKKGRQQTRNAGYSRYPLSKGFTCQHLRSERVFRKREMYTESQGSSKPEAWIGFMPQNGDLSNVFDEFYNKIGQESSNAFILLLCAGRLPFGAESFEFVQ